MQPSETSPEMKCNYLCTFGLISECNKQLVINRSYHATDPVAAQTFHLFFTKNDSANMFPSSFAGIMVSLCLLVWQVLIISISYPCSLMTRVIACVCSPNEQMRNEHQFPIIQSNVRKVQRFWEKKGMVLKLLWENRCSCQSDLAAAVTRGATEVDNINGCLWGMAIEFEWWQWFISFWHKNGDCNSLVIVFTTKTPCDILPYHQCNGDSEKMWAGDNGKCGCQPSYSHLLNQRLCWKLLPSTDGDRFE